MIAPVHSRPGMLQEYSHLKLKLAAIVRNVLYRAEQRKDEASVQECRRILARLAEDRFNLAILGQFSRGKSSLMNAILGSRKLPTGILPLTSVITTVTYGEKEKVLLQREGWTSPQEIGLEQLPDYVTQQGNPGNEKRVTLAQIQLPNEILRLGVHFIDTPGVASTIAANTQTTRQFLPEADAAILVTSFDSPMTETELKFLEELRQHARRIFIVVNKLDLVSATDREPVLASIRETLRANFPDSEFDLFAVSARDALRAKQASSAEALTMSGLPNLEAALTDFLRRDKFRELLLRAAERTIKVVRQQEIAIQIAQSASSPLEAQNLQKRLKDAVNQVRSDANAVLRHMENRLRLEFPRVCEEKIGLWSAESEAHINAALTNWFKRDKDQISIPPFEEVLQETCGRVFSDWVSKHREVIERAFHELVQADGPKLEKLESEIAGIALNVLGLEEGTAGATPRRSDNGTLAFRELHIPTEGLEVPWWYEVLPFSGAREIVARKWLRRIGEITVRYQDAAFSLLEAAAGDWVDALKREYERRITTVESHVSHSLTEKHDVEELTQIKELQQQIQEFVTSVEGIRDDGEDSARGLTSAASGEPSSTANRPCVICLRLERALRDFMAHAQYELAVSEADQEQHAQISGFCPLHTWHYEAIASPQGVCAAYPKLLTLMAARLRRFAQEANSVRSMEEGVRSILPKESQCPACRIMGSAEEIASREVVQRLTRDHQPTSVCVVHLRSVLAAGPDLETAATLTIEEADALDRLAEDMENHVLKHEAVRHHLSTRAERAASTDGLARVVGRRNAVMPEKVE